MIMDEGNYLAHYGVLRRSGRYPWGSGGNASTASDRRHFLDTVASLKKEGLGDTEIARLFEMTTTQLRTARSIAKNEQKQADIAMAQRLKDKGMSNVAIGEQMGINESSVRSLLAPGAKDKADVLTSVSSMLKDQVADKAYIDVGGGVENQLGISKEKLNTAVTQLTNEGYTIHYVKVPQLGTDKMTSIKVLAAPDTAYSEVFRNRDNIRQITEFSDDGGRSFMATQPPLSINSKRVAVRYAEDGGADADGVIYVRPGVDDVSLGGSRYAQVRIAVDGTRYLKGMAMYKDDLPDGVDLMFNTNKKDTGNKLDAMKKISDDPDNPFGANISRQVLNDKGKVKSVMNIVNEEGRWDEWSKNLSSQMLSKQSPALAKSQLDMTFERRKNQLDEIKALTNPAVKKKLLDAFAEDADAAAVHLKAAALPGQRTQVLLPVNSLKSTEIYAPNFSNGDRVALVRYPHGGKFEIPELTVNNRHPEAKKLLGNAKDAVGINAKVAERLSGADFDGDTVLVIPNNHGKVKTQSPLQGLKGFDPQSAYPAYEGMPKMSARTKGTQMGLVSNLITDMTIKGATAGELARAVRHSMVVIDAEKHNLNYKQSAIDNGISSLMKKYQDRSQGGASTLISKASSSVRVPDRRLRRASEGGPVDPKTGKKVYVDTGASYVDKNGRTVFKTVGSKKLAETDDANTLSSGTPIEKIYASHSNSLKGLANEARKAATQTKPTPWSNSAKEVYAKQVDSLNAKLHVAQKNRPLERQAQIIANAAVRTKRASNPDMDAADLKKLKSQELEKARIRTGAHKQQINIDQDEWNAIQSGAVSNHKLNQILDNANMDRVKELATPKAVLLMTSAKSSRARSMLNSGYTQAEVAQALGVSLTTLKNSLK